MPINDRASKEARDRAIDPRVPGMPVEKLGRNSASWKPRRRRRGREEKTSARIPARQNSHVIPRVEFDDGMAVSMPSRRVDRAGIATFAIGSCPPWCNQCSIHRWIVTDSLGVIHVSARINQRVCQSRLYVRNYRSARYIDHNTRIIMHVEMCLLSTCVKRSLHAARPHV